MIKENKQKICTATERKNFGFVLIFDVATKIHSNDIMAAEL